MHPNPPRPSQTPRRLPPSSRPRVALLLLGLILCALLVLRQRAQVSGDVTSGRAATKAEPTARIDPGGGAARQGEFQILAVTREEGNIFSPPNGARVYPSLGIATPDGTGLWVRAEGGTGAKLEPLLLGENRFPVGNYWLVTNIPPGFDFSSPVGQWRMTDGVTPVTSGREPYSMSVVRQQSVSPNDSHNGILLLPPGLQKRFQVTARPLSRSMKPLGPPVPLIWQPAGEDVLFVQIPTGYSAQTRAFEITAARQDTPEKIARWRVRDLPPAPPPAGSLSEAVAGRREIGKLAVTAQASESPDFWSSGGLWERTPPATAADPPVNLDGHSWSGVPSVRCRLHVETMPGVAPGEYWEMVVRTAAPEWSVPAETGVLNNIFNRSGPRPTFITLRPAEVLEPLSGPATQEITCGVAYPGQQHYVRLQADVVRYATHVEPLVFHDADIVADKTTPGGRLVWRHSQTLDTPSGLSVSVLNARRPAAVTAANEFPDNPLINNSWFYRRLRPGGKTPPGSVELRLGWTVPNRITQIAPPPGSHGQMFLPWSLSVGDGWQTSGGPQPGQWTGMWLPGAPPPGAPHPVPSAPTGIGSAFGSQGAALRAARRPDALTPLIHRSFIPLALQIVPADARPLPSHLDSLTVLVRTRVEMERRSVTLTVPISSRLATAFKGQASRE